MAQIINHSFDTIPKSYLFSEVARRVAAFRAAHPEKRLIPMGIGDVTRPLRRPVIEALKKAAEEQTHAESFHGYGPEQGYDFLRQAVLGHYAGFGVHLEKRMFSSATEPRATWATCRTCSPGTASCFCPTRCIPSTGIPT